jgi:hypothetical protein
MLGSRACVLVQELGSQENGLIRQHKNHASALLTHGRCTTTTQQPDHRRVVSCPQRRACRLPTTLTTGAVLPYQHM